MHLNCHNAYPRLSANYFCQILHHKRELQNTSFILLIQSITCNYFLELHDPFNIEHFHEEKNHSAKLYS